MSVSETVTIPGQPSGAGVVRYLPLGGDGWTSPQSCYYLESMVSEADAGAGTNQVTVNMDNQYSTVISTIQCSILSAANAPEALFRIFYQGLNGLLLEAQRTLDLISFGTTATKQWNPAPLFNPDIFTVVTENVDTEDLVVSAVMYNFRKRAVEEVPLAVLLASLPRDGSLT